MTRHLKKILLISLLIYSVMCLILYFGQRELMYRPGLDVVDPQTLQLQAKQVTLTTSDNERILAWFTQPHAGKATLLFFKGNAGTLQYNKELFRLVESSGMGLLAVSWRGFGGSSGFPTEEGLYIDARTALDFLAKQGIGPKSIIYFGESLGSGVAVQLATEAHPKAVVLSAPYTSMPDAAGEHYPFFPTHWLVRDRYDSFSKIKKIGAPLVILHGTRDSIVPYTLGQQLFEEALQPKHFIRMDGVGHVITITPQLWQKILSTLAVQ